MRKTGKRYEVPLPLCSRSASPTGGKEAEEYDLGWRFSQGGARFQRCLPWAGMFRAFSAAAASRRVTWWSVARHFSKERLR